MQLKDHIANTDILFFFWGGGIILGDKQNVFYIPYSIIYFLYSLFTGTTTYAHLI